MTQNLIISQSFESFLYESMHKGCKVSRVLIKLRNLQTFQHHLGIKLLNTSEINYLTLRNDGTISYLPKGKEHKINGNGEWMRDGRQNGKPSKVIRKIFSDKIFSKLTDKDFEDFANIYKAKNTHNNLTVETLPSSEIPRIYDMDCLESGTLFNSCMKGRGEDSYLEIYENCKHLQIITLIDKTQNILHGRALLWQYDGKFFVDRVYTAKDEYVQMFKDFAIDNKYYYKKDIQSSGNKLQFINPLGEIENVRIRIELNTNFDYFPYIDTLTYGGDGYITNDSEGTEYEYCNTDGTREEHEQYYCEHSGNYYEQDDVYYIDRGLYSGSYVHRDFAVEIGRYMYYIEDENIINIDGDYYHIEERSDEIGFCEDIQEWRLIDDCVICDIGQYEGMYISTENARSVCDKYIVHEDDINEL